MQPHIYGGSMAYFRKQNASEFGLTKTQENLKHVIQCAAKCQRSNSCQFYHYHKNMTAINNVCTIWTN